mgnify:CR=1 FL=1
MQKIILSALCTMCLLSCNYVRFTRHLEGRIGDEIFFSSGGQVLQKYFLSATDLVNRLSDNINPSTSKITNIQISDIRMKVSLSPGNTASILKNINCSVTSLKDTLYSYNSEWKFVESSVFLVNAYIKNIGLDLLKSKIEEAIVNKLNTIGYLNLGFTVPSGEKIIGSIKISLTVSMDVITCEKVPFGLGPSEC